MNTAAQNWRSCYLLVSELGQPLLGSNEEFALVKTSKLGINVQVLLVQDLQNRVEQARQRRIVGLLDNFGAGSFRVVLRDDRRQLVDVHDVLGALLVRAALDKLELLGGHADGLEDGGDDETVVLDAQLDQLDGRFQVIEEAVDIGEQDRDMAAGGQVLGDFDCGDKVATVRATGGGGAWTMFVSVFCSFDRVSVDEAVSIFIISPTYPSRSWDADPRPGFSR